MGSEKLRLVDQTHQVPASGTVLQKNLNPITQGKCLKFQTIFSGKKLFQLRFYHKEFFFLDFRIKKSGIQKNNETINKNAALNFLGQV